MNRFNSSALICGLMLLVLGTGAGAATEPPRAVLTSLDMDFGRAAKGEVVERSVLLQNEGGAPLSVSFGAVSMRGLKARYKKILPPGEETEITLIMDTSDLNGEVEAQAIVHFNDPQQPQAILSLRGEVVPPIQILPLPAVYFSLYPGETVERRVTFMNNQKHPVNILSMEKQGQHFEAELETTEPGMTYEIRFTVPAGVGPGRYRERLVIKTDESKGGGYPVAVNVLVKPDLFAFPEEITYGQLSKGDLQANPDLLELLKKVLVIQKREGMFRIESIETTVDVLDIVQSPKGPAETISLDIHLATDRMEPGPINGTITVRTDDPAFSELVIPVVGEVQ